MSVASKMAAKPKGWRTDSVTDVTGRSGRGYRRCVSASTSIFSISSVVVAEGSLDVSRQLSRSEARASSRSGGMQHFLSVSLTWWRSASSDPQQTSDLAVVPHKGDGGEDDMVAFWWRVRSSEVASSRASIRCIPCWLGAGSLCEVPYATIEDREYLGDIWHIHYKNVKQSFPRHSVHRAAQCFLPLMPDHGYGTSDHAVCLFVVPAFTGTHCAWPWSDGQAELTWVACYISSWFIHLLMVINPGTNWAWCIHCKPRVRWDA